MRAVSAALLRTIRGSHVMRSRARAVMPGQQGVNPTGVELPIVDGDVQYEVVDDTTDADTVKTATIKGTADVTVSADWPRAATDPVAPYGQEVYLERGVQIAGGGTEWVGLGYFRINTIEQTGDPHGSIRISASDRMQGIIDARLLRPVQFRPTHSVGYVLNLLVSQVYPSAVIEWDDTSVRDSLIGRSMVTADDRYGFLTDLLTAYRKVWRWDHRGHLMISTPPDTTTPVFVVDAGRDGVLVSMDRDLSRDSVYNAVVATGEAADTTPPVRGVAYDNDPTSPTYYQGGYGKVPRYYSSSFLTTNDQCQQTAAALLLQSLGAPYNVSFGSIVNPALEPLDPVAIAYPERPRSEGVVIEGHVIESLTVPLVPGTAMTAKTRQQQVGVIGSDDAVL